MLAHPVVDQAVRSVPLDAVGLSAFAAIFATVAFLMWKRPSYAVAVLVAVVPFALYRTIGPTTITLPKAALAGAVVGLLLRRESPGALGGRASRTLALAGLAVVLATALSIWHATYRGPALRETLKAAEYLLLFATVAIAARADDDDRAIGFAFVASLMLVSVLALAQEVVGAPSGMWFLGHAIPRIAGPLEGPNQLSGYLGIALSIVAALSLARPRVASGLAALALGLGTLVLTASRTGIPAAVAALATVVAVSPRRPSRRDYGVMACGILGALGVLAAWGLSLGHAGTGVWAVFVHLSTVAEAQQPGSVGNRSQLWAAALLLWRAHPFFGIGAGNFELELGLAGFPQLHTHANSLFWQSLVEGGIPLATATLSLVAASILVFRRGPFGRPFVVGALGASIGLAFHQVLDLLVFYPKVGELWWIALALGAARKDQAVLPPVA